MRLLSKKHALTALGIACLCLTGCSSDAAESVAETVTGTEQITETQSPETAEETEPAETQAAAAVTAVADAGTYVFDECGVLSEEELAKYNAYLTEISDTRLICTAAVITENLDGASPEGFAEAYYRTLYGEETSGFLLLINNDTGEDIFYTSGVCSTYISQADISLAIAKATPYLVEESYAGAMDILLPLGEMVPLYVLDRSGTLSQETVNTLLAAAQEKQISLLLVKGVVPDDAEDAASALSAYAEEKRTLTGASSLLVIDVQAVCSAIAGEIPENADDIAALVQAGSFTEAAELYYNIDLTAEDSTGD
jgi:hypothetical protein